MTRYERLQPIDSAFLYAESPTAHMHVGSLTIFQDADSRELALLSHVERRLHLVESGPPNPSWPSPAGPRRLRAGLEPSTPGISRIM